MIECNKCVNRCGLKEYYEQRGEHIVKCPSYKPQTNADLLRTMSDEELAEWFDLHASEPLWCVLPECPDNECVKCILKWLKSPVEPGEVDNGT